MRPPASVYVHFPWCLKKCPYCDFATRKIDRPAIRQRAYTDAVLRELELRASAIEGRALLSIFFGGGTPSLWEPEELARVIEAVHARFGQHAPEVTIECNPSSLDRARAAAFVEAGVDRISLGIQSLDDERLRFLGRFHDAAGAVEALEGCLAVAPRTSVDFMFGMPGQSVEGAARDLEAVLALGVQHVSAYALTIEPGTQFGELHRKGRLPVAPEESFAEIYGRTEAILAAHGLEHYEVSNYAVPGEESLHNAAYWRGSAYLGLGAAAVGCLDEGLGRARRWRNVPDGDAYLEAMRGGLRELEQESEALDAETLIREALMLGLRTARGVELDATEARTGVPALRGRERAVERALAAGDLTLEAGVLRVPKERWLYLDGIVAALF